VSINTGSTAAQAQSLDHPGLAQLGLVILVALAIALRLEPILVVPSTVWPDEIFQATEPAHRLVFGSGLVPWEFQLGARSWLLPSVIAALMELSRLVGDGPDYYLPLIAVAFAALAAAPVICCFLWCRPLFGATGALLAGSVVAVAPELVYFGARTLSEVVAGHLLVVALYVLEPGHRTTSRRRLVGGGALLGLVFVTRVQLAPALLVAALWTNWPLYRERLVAVLGGAVVILTAAGLLDTLTLGFPLVSLWRYVLYNAYYEVSSTFGVEPWIYYFVGELGVWRSACVTLLLLVVFGARQMPLLLVLAVVILAVHSGIAHKEYRFIYPAILLVAVLSGVGLAQVACWGRDWLTDRGTPKKIAALAGAGFALGWWCLASFQVWTGATLTGLRGRVHDNLSAASFVAREPAVCGIGLYGIGGIDWVDSGGYTYLHHPAPIFWPKNEATLIASATGFDTLVYTRAPPSELGFGTVRCFGQVCVARRSGGCQSLLSDVMPMPDALVDTAALKATASRRGMPP